MIKSKAFLKIVCVTQTIVLLSACTSTRSRFPDYGGEVETHSKVAVVLDLFVYRDLTGIKRGVEDTLTAETIEAVTSQIEEGFAEKGFVAEVVAKLNGMTYDFGSKEEYVISEKWKSTGQEYVPIPNDRSIWYSDQTRDFFDHLVSVAAQINLKKGMDQHSAEELIATKVDAPIVPLSERELEAQLFAGLDSDIVVFLKVEGRLQGLGKYLANGILIGAITRSLTGGLVVVPPGTYARAEAVAFDPESRLIKWHNVGGAEYNRAFPLSVKSVLRNYPRSDGKKSARRTRNRALIPPSR